MALPVGGGPLSAAPPWGDRGRVPQRWLDSHAFRTAYEPVHSYASVVFVAAYLPGWPSVERLPREAQPLEVRYSPALRLIGYQLLTPAQPDRQLHVALYWAVDEPIPEEALEFIADRLPGDARRLAGAIEAAAALEEKVWLRLGRG